MKKKTLLFSVLMIVVFLMIISLVLYFVIDLDSFKPRIQTALSNALRLNVRINGDIGFIFSPGLHISLEDIKISGKESNIASLENVAFGLELLPLLKGKVFIDEIAIKRPEISLVRFKNGEFNITQRIQEQTKEEEKDALPFVADTISLSGGDIIYTDHKNGTETKISGVDVVIKDLSTGRSGKAGLMQNISFKGSLHSKKVTSHAVELSDVSFQMLVKEGLLDIKPFFMTVFGGKGKGEIAFAATGKTQSLNIQATISQLHLEEFLHAFSEKKTMEGNVDLSLNVSMQGKGMNEMKKTMNGHISMQGENIVTRNYDIDSILGHYRKSQRIGALDIGVFFLAGPAGTAVTKGYDYAKLMGSTGARGGIMKKLVSVWKVEQGLATAEDVAIATRDHRVAVKGKLNLVNETYENLIVAVINQKGCAEATQKIHGSLHNPQLEKTSILQSAAGSVLKIFDKAGKLIPNEHCEPFYNGSVQHPQ